MRSCPFNMLVHVPNPDTHDNAILGCNVSWITSQDGAADPGGGVAGLAAAAVQIFSAAGPSQSVSDAADAARAGGRVAGDREDC